MAGVMVVRFHQRSYMFIIIKYFCFTLLVVRENSEPPTPHGLALCESSTPEGVTNLLFFKRNIINNTFIYNLCVIYFVVSKIITTFASDKEKNIIDY